MQLSRPDSCRRPRGFTLVELMVTVALLSVLLMAVLPDIASWQRNMQLRNVASSLQSGLDKAREEAVRRNRIVRFSLVAVNDPSSLDDSCKLSSAGSSWVVSLADPTAQCSKSVSSTTSPMIVAKHAAGQGASKTVVAAKTLDGSGATTVSFNQYGRLVGDADDIASIEVDATQPDEATRKLLIFISPEGGARMCDPKVTDSKDPRKCPSDSK